jgi:hypothetical protein
MIVTDKLSTENFHAFIDEQLSDEQYVQVEAQLDEIPEKVEEIQQCQIINERLREVFDPIVEEDIPEDLYELGLYGIISEEQDDTQDFQQFGYEFDEANNAITGFNEEIASPLDSFDTALELQDENFIDDNEFAELEELSAGSNQGLTDFDIDNIRDDAGNILPDIFGEDERASFYATSQPAQIADDQSMLDEIGELSLEPLEREEEVAIAQDQESIAPQTFTEGPTSEAVIADTFEDAVPDLELEPVEQSDDSSSLDIPELEEQIPVPSEKVIAQDQTQKRQRILNTLEASEELSLAPLEGEEATVPMPDFGDYEPEESDSSAEVAANLLGDTEETTAAQETGEEEAALSTTEQLEVEPPAERGQGDLFVETTPLEAEVEVSQAPAINADENQAVTRNKDIESATGTVDASEFPIDEIVEQLDEIPDGNEQVPSDVVAEFFSESKTEPDFEVSEVVKQFEEVADEFEHHHDQEPFDSPVAQIKHKADEVLHNINSKFSALKSTFTRKEEESYPDFNKAPPPFQVGTSHPETSRQAYQSKAEESLEAASFEFETDFDEDEKPQGLTRKIGETLKFYKEKLSQGKTIDEMSPAGNQIVPHVEATGLEKYKQIIARNLDRVSPENRMTIGGAILLIIGLLIGGSVASLFEKPVNAITAEKVEQLAIDAHILYTQQNQNFAGNPSTSITESMQWLSARIGRQIRLADVQLEDFTHQRAIVMPTMVSYATANIFENKNNQSITLLISANVEPVADAPLVCRVPTGVDGLCSWVKDSVQYVAVANLSLSRVRAFSQALVDNL